MTSRGLQLVVPNLQPYAAEVAKHVLMQPSDTARHWTADAAERRGTLGPHLPGGSDRSN